MNKTELKNFAVSSRRDLLEKVSLRAKKFGIDENNSLTIEDKFGQLAINGDIYSSDKKSMFLSLKKQLETKGYEQLIEEVAYTWFNRIVAIRYMEVNEYLPERVNVLSSSTGKVEPDILSQFETMSINIDIEKIKEFSSKGEMEESYRKLFIAQCNALNKILPFMFEKIQDYTELLLPDYLLDSESVIKKLVSNIALTDSFKEVEVIGWLYQFYNLELKGKIFADMKKSKKIEKYNIPAATQLFTPKWIAEYMVENSVGQLWLESNPNSPLKEKMSYYIMPAEQDEEGKKKIEEIRYKNINLEEITIMDPCVGSGHILVYAFDLLYKMYEEAGYPSSNIPQLILEKNLYGLDIDDRSVQLASFALMMKAREKSRRIFQKQIKLNVLSIQESNHLDKEGIAQLIGKTAEEKQELYSMIETFIDGKNFGSILKPSIIDYEKYYNKLNEFGEEQLSLESYQAFEQIESFKALLKQTELLLTKYDVVLTNPPYMGGKGMNKKLLQYLQINYPISKSDLFAVFLERTMSYTKVNGFTCNINQQSWMFLSKYENLRNDVLNNFTIISMLHLGSRAFDDIGGEIVQSTSFVLRNCILENPRGVFHRLVDYKSSEAKRSALIDSKNSYVTEQSSFSNIPGSPIAYWCSERVKEIFQEFNTINSNAKPRQGLSTSDNERFLRKWFEVSIEKIGFDLTSRTEAKLSQKKWFPYNKGGTYQKWYGNNEYVLNWFDDGKELREWADYLNKTRTPMGRLVNKEYYFKEGITWSSVTTSSLSMRYSKGAIFDAKGPMLFADDSNKLFGILAFLNSKIATEFLQLLSPTMDYSQGPIGMLPFKLDESKEDFIKEKVLLSIEITKENWDSFESSWDFKCHPLLINKLSSDLLSTAYNNWSNYTNLKISNLMEWEKELNSLFIDLYRLQREVSPIVSKEEITINKGNRISDSKSFLSYFIGCMMGRYSLDTEGIAYAGGIWNDSKYRVFKPNKFGLIHLTDEHYFEDDIITRLREFLTKTFGIETVDENLQWLAESLDIKLNETSEERLRRYFLDEFFKDHCQVYQKRPIYWLVDSGKNKGLRTLIYMHRYQPDTMATIRFEHLQEIQSKYNNEIAAVELRIVNPHLSATEKRELEKRKTFFQKRLEELFEFDKKLSVYANAQLVIDLDDGVSVNYKEFDKVLAKIK